MRSAEAYRRSTVVINVFLQLFIVLLGAGTGSIRAKFSHFLRVKGWAHRRQLDTPSVEEDVSAHATLTRLGRCCMGRASERIRKPSIQTEPRSGV